MSKNSLAYTNINTAAAKNTAKPKQSNPILQHDFVVDRVWLCCSSSIFSIRPYYHWNPPINFVIKSNHKKDSVKVSISRKESLGLKQAPYLQFIKVWSISGIKEWNGNLN